MARQEKITPQEAVEAVIGLVNMINKEQLNKLNKLDEIDGLRTRLDDVESSVRAFDATLSQPVKVEDPTLIEEGQITRNHCIRYSYIYAKNSYKLLKDIENEILNNISDGAIILMHDYIGKNSPTPEALEIIIPALIKKGYEFVTVGELISD